MALHLPLIPLWGTKLCLKGHRPSCDHEDKGPCQGWQNRNLKGPWSLITHPNRSGPLLLDFLLLEKESPKALFA